VHSGKLSVSGIIFCLGGDRQGPWEGAEQRQRGTYFISWALLSSLSLSGLERSHSPNLLPQQFWNQRHFPGGTGIDGGLLKA
jgi:hypothetical protein